MLHVYNEKNKCVIYFQQKAFSGLRVFATIDFMLRLNWYPFGDEVNYEPSSAHAIKILDKVMDELKASQNGQTFAFRSDTAEDVYGKLVGDNFLRPYYGKEMVIAKEFKFLKEGSDRVRPDTKSILIFDQYMRFNNAKHNDNHCVALTNLPRFYKKKGEDPY